MRRARQFQVLACLTLMILTASAEAKCVMGTVTVHGRLNDFHANSSNAELLVIVETPKGNISRKASISNGNFTVEVPFPTLSSSFMGGDRCHNKPKTVEVRAAIGGKIYVRKRIVFNDNFEMHGAYLYRLKHDLDMDNLQLFAEPKANSQEPGASSQ